MQIEAKFVEFTLEEIAKDSMLEKFIEGFICSLCQ